jgi:hypothetical protein
MPLKASGTKSGKAFGRPRVPAETEQRIRDALATPGRPGFHKIAAHLAWRLARCSESRTVRMARRDAKPISPGATPWTPPQSVRLSA